MEMLWRTSGALRKVASSFLSIRHNNTDPAEEGPGSGACLLRRYKAAKNAQCHGGSFRLCKLPQNCHANLYCPNPFDPYRSDCC